MCLPLKKLYSDKGNTIMNTQNQQMPNGFMPNGDQNGFMPNQQMPNGVMMQNNQPTQAIQQAPMMPASASNNLPSFGNGNISLSEDLLSKIQAMSGAGVEEADQKAISLPYIYILQNTSTVINTANGDQNLKPGMFFHTLNNEAFSEFYFSPCHFQRRYSRFNNGEYVATYDANDIEQGRVAGVSKNPNGYGFIINDNLGFGELVDCRFHYIMFLNPKTQTWEAAILNLNKTAVKASKRLTSLIYLSEATINGRTIANPPSWCFVYKASIVKEHNDRGHWFSWAFSKVGTFFDHFDKCQAFHESIKKMEIDFESQYTQTEAIVQSQTPSQPLHYEAPASQPYQAMQQAPMMQNQQAHYQSMQQAQGMPNQPMTNQGNEDIPF